MNDAELLIEKLKIIKENNIDSVDLTHKDIIIFCQTIIILIKNNQFLEDSQFSRDAIDRIVFYLKLISAYGILHKYRSHLASKCLKYIKDYLYAKREAEIAKSSGENWQEIPF